MQLKLVPKYSWSVFYKKKGAKNLIVFSFWIILQAHDFMSVDDLRKIFQVEHHNDGK